MSVEEGGEAGVFADGVQVEVDSQPKCGAAEIDLD
jgi:hypothetical protein